MPDQCWQLHQSWKNDSWKENFILNCIGFISTPKTKLNFLDAFTTSLMLTKHNAVCVNIFACFFSLLQMMNLVQRVVVLQKLLTIHPNLSLLSMATHQINPQHPISVIFRYLLGHMPQPIHLQRFPIQKVSYLSLSVLYNNLTCFPYTLLLKSLG